MKEHDGVVSGAWKIAAFIFIVMLYNPAGSVCALVVEKCVCALWGTTETVYIDESISELPLAESRVGWTKGTRPVVVFGETTSICDDGHLIEDISTLRSKVRGEHGSIVAAVDGGAVVVVDLSCPGGGGLVVVPGMDVEVA